MNKYTAPPTSSHQPSSPFRIVLVEDAISALYPRGKDEILNIGVLVTNVEIVKNIII